MKTAFLTELFTNEHSMIGLYKPEIQEFVRINQHGFEMFELEGLAEFSKHFKSGNIWVNPPKDLQQYLVNINSAASLHGHLLNEVLYKTAKGRSFWGLLELQPFRNNDEDFILVKITNITHIKEGKTQTQPTSEQLHALFENSTIGIVITDSEGIIVNFNQYAERQFGYIKDEVIGRPVEKLIPNQFRRKHKDYKETFIAHPENRVMGAGRDLYALRKDQTQFPVEISLSHYKSDDRSHVIAFVIDITIRKRNEELLLTQKDELERSSHLITEMNQELEKKVEGRTNMLKETLAELERSKQELSTALDKERELGDLKSKFVTMASHEFRTPLSTILSSAYIVEKYRTDSDQDKRVRHLEKIKASVQTLTFILEDFLSLEKLEQGVIKSNIHLIEKGDLKREIELVTEEMTGLVKPGQYFVVSFDSFEPVLSDLKLVKSILINLLSNAIKYSPENSPINIRVYVSGTELEIDISDQGIGIPEGEQHNLFEKFFRASNASSIQGTGLGLNIVNRYLSLIKGKIRMQSALNKGTTFTISISTLDSRSNIASAIDLN